MHFALYVPRPGFPLSCDPKSAIVGSHARQWFEEREALIDGRLPKQVAPDTNLIVDYEGNRYGALNMQTYADRALVCAGRHKKKYPTVARCVVPAKRLIRVATFDYETEQVELLGDDEILTLMRWLDVGRVELQAELHGTSVRSMRAAVADG